MKDAVIIGAGLAGLNCAIALQRAGLDIALVEASDAAGGRVRTDEFKGFRLDRGFQVLLSAYPETQSALDHHTLELKCFKPGALVWRGGHFHHFADPFREPLSALKLMLDPIVPFGDKLKVARLRARVQQGTPAELFQRNETTTREHLTAFGFSPRIVERFFEPFFGGVFLEKQLITSSRYFEFLFRMFAAGDATVPENGMGAIPAQLAGRLKPGALLVNARVAKMARNSEGFLVETTGQQSFTSRRLVIATAEPQASTLIAQLGSPSLPARTVTWNRTTTLYFAAERAPIDQPILMLNGEGGSAGPVNNAVVMSNVSRKYAPAGAHLISASVIGDVPSTPEQLSKLEQFVRQHLKKWLGPQTGRWELLRAYSIEYALPRQETTSWNGAASESGIPGVFLCGDFLTTASIQGALVSGRQAAESLLSEHSAPERVSQ